MNIYIGNLPFSTTADDLKQAFSAFGEVSNVNLITDKFSGRSKGFGFVEMPNDSEAKAAIEKLDQSALSGRNIRVSEAKPRETNTSSRPPRRDFR